MLDRTVGALAILMASGSYPPAPDDTQLTPEEYWTCVIPTGVAVTAAGKQIDFASGLSSNSGSNVVVSYKQIKQPALYSLLNDWIAEYGDTADPDLGQQIAELRGSRFSLDTP